MKTITMENNAKNKNKASEFLIMIVLAVCALTTVVTVGFIVLFLFYTAIPAIAEVGFIDFIFGDNWNPTGDLIFCEECCWEVIGEIPPSFGIRNLIITSFAGTFGAILIGVPIGILAAVAIAEILPKKVATVILPSVNLLAGIPSVVYGAVGLILLVPFVQKIFDLTMGTTLFSAIIVLSVMVLPTIISVSVTSIRAVPKTYMEASLALGLTKEASIYKIILPAAKSGILTSVLLGLGRAIGEAMAIILVAGNVPNVPELFEPARFLTTGIVAEFSYSTGLHREVLFAIGAVLFVFILIINSLFYAIIRRVGRNNG
jgi:phosphate transport system permease protein